MKILIVYAFFTLTVHGLIVSSAAQSIPEFPVQCSEGSEPLVLSYGEHTSNCEIDVPTDLDRFGFAGSAGDIIRIVVRQTSGRLDPRLEIRDPQGNEIFNEFCFDACTVRADLSLTASGTYLVLVSDEVADQTGTYTLQMEKIPPVLNPPSIPHDMAVNETIDPVTDVDFFTFEADANTTIRIVVRQTSGRLDPRLEIQDPQGNEIFNEFCFDACTVRVDLSLTTTGIYLLLVSDEAADQTGTYQVNIQCLSGSCIDMIPGPPVGGSVTGFTTSNAICRNDSTGQSVIIPLEGAMSWDCEAAGLVVNKGDQVFSGAEGEVGAEPPPPPFQVLGIFSETAEPRLMPGEDAFIGTFDGGDATFDEFVEDTNDLQDGTVSLRSTVSVNASGGGFAGWFVSWGAEGQAGDNNVVRDMSAFAAGKLLFWVKSPTFHRIKW